MECKLVKKEEKRPVKWKKIEVLGDECEELLQSTWISDIQMDCVPCWSWQGLDYEHMSPEALRSGGVGQWGVSGSHTVSPIPAMPAHFFSQIYVRLWLRNHNQAY